MTRMAASKPAPASQTSLLDAELADLPQELRWREWMGRVEAAIFASTKPVSREALSLLVGNNCVLDDLIGDIQDELKPRPYELAFVAGGWQHRTKPRFANAIRAASKLREPGPPDLSKTETMVLTLIAYFQPITRAKVSDMLGRDISRDTIARLKRLTLIGAGPRVAQPGAPLTYVTTTTFLSVFGLSTLRELPNIEAIQDASSTDNDVTLPGSLGYNELEELDDMLATDDASFVLERDESLNG
jgi:segregation and condensation protein B